MSTRSVGQSDHQTVPRAKAVIDRWIVGEGLQGEMVIGVREIEGSDALMLTHVQRGWDGKPVYTKPGIFMLSQRKHEPRRPFPFDTIEALRRVETDELLPGVTPRQAALRIVNGGNPFKEGD